MEEFLVERYELVTERIREIEKEQILPDRWQEYFVFFAGYVKQMYEYLILVQEKGIESMTLKELQKWNELMQDNCPSPCGECASVLDILSGELHSLGFLAAQERPEEFLVRLELFTEIYGICIYEWQEEKHLPDYKLLQECFYWYVNDYADMAPLQELQYLMCPETSPIFRLLQRENIAEEDYLYRYGTTISERERNLREWLQELPLEEVDIWATKLAEEIIELSVENSMPTTSNRLVLQYPAGYERLVRLLVVKLKEESLDTVPVIAGTGVLLRLYEKDFSGRNLLWDKALTKRCREIKQTLAEKVARENKFGITRVVLKEEKTDILKPHVV